MSGVIVNGDAGHDADPAAEFLAREQDELAGLGDDLPDVRNVKIEDESGTGLDEFELLSSTAPPTIAAEIDPFGFETASAPAPAADFIEPPVTAPMASSFGFVGGNFENNEDARGGDYDDDFMQAPTPMSQSREEPEKIRKWREEQKIRLEQKDKDEEIQKGKLRESAKKELEEWYKAHEEQISKTKASNRAAEKEYQAMSAEVVPGQEWERIAKLCEFNPKLTRTSKDTSRMRSIILQLKQSPPAKNGTDSS